MGEPSLKEQANTHDGVELPSAPVGIAIDLAQLEPRRELQRRSWAASLLIAFSAHAIAISAMLPTRGSVPAGAGGSELEAIDVELVTTAVLESRYASGSVGAAQDRAVDYSVDGGTELDAAPETADREPANLESKEQSAGLIPDLVVPDAEPEKPAEDPTAIALAIARARPETPSELPKPVEPERTGKPEPWESPQSRAAAAREAARQGGADARGLDPADLPGARAAAASPGAANEYARAVIQTLARRKPRATAGVRGTVRIGFTVARSGVVSEARVLRSSGQPVLDEAALDAVRNAKFPTPPPELAAIELKYEIPYIFR
jgi:protein TonB